MFKNVTRTIGILLFSLYCWYLKTLKLALPPTRNLKFAFHPTRHPNASQWNIGCVGSPTQNFGVGHVHFTFFGVNFISVGYRFSVEYGLIIQSIYTYQICIDVIKSDSSHIKIFLIANNMYLLDRL